MIRYEEFTLDNGLQVIVHEDPSVQIAVMNILYDVGSRDERPDKTGFAHLFEHLMFGGSKHVPNYDEPLQKVGGENNAFTSADITNYYLTVPSSNLETGFWLESDRMLSLSFDPEVLEVQRKVVIEEFKQRYLNQPYGDVWLKLRPLTYQVHPYQWATIGKEISHIEEATMDDVKSFFHTHYVPSNAIMVVAGNVTLEQVKQLSEKWFGPIPGGKKPVRDLPVEPKQKASRHITVEADVPANALYRAYHMPGRLDKDYYAFDLLSDILGGGRSSQLYHHLVTEKKLFSSVSSFIMGSFDPGLLVVNGRLSNNVSWEQAVEEVDRVIHKIHERQLGATELDKVKAKSESYVEFSAIEVINRAMNLAMAKVNGDVSQVNKEVESIQAVTIDDVYRLADTWLTDDNKSEMYYQSTGGN